ncbi:hypothetical protein ACIP1T_21575 [Pseudomonas japonica]|uniref:hypothetical protein n=1 Tax=Pseudomonas japonica TaxID=256466 RepID=UPI003825E62E
MKVLGVVGVCVLLSGCATDNAGRTEVIINPQPTWPWKKTAPELDLSSCKSGGECSYYDAYSSIMATGAYCRDVSNFYENGGNINSNTRLGVKILGVLAGSVFGITAGGSAAKAWSGLSGATNGIQSDLSDSALARSNRARVVAQILSEYTKEIKPRLEKTTIDVVDRRAIVNLSFEATLKCATLAQIEPESETKKVDDKVEELKKLVEGKTGNESRGQAGGSESSSAAPKK